MATKWQGARPATVPLAGSNRRPAAYRLQSRGRGGGGGGGGRVQTGWGRAGRGQLRAKQGREHTRPGPGYPRRPSGTLPPSCTNAGRRRCRPACCRDPSASPSAHLMSPPMLWPSRLMRRRPRCCAATPRISSAKRSPHASIPSNVCAKDRGWGQGQLHWCIFHVPARLLSHWVLSCRGLTLTLPHLLALVAVRHKEQGGAAVQVIGQQAANLLRASGSRCRHAGSRPRSAQAGGGDCPAAQRSRRSARSWAIHATAGGRRQGCCCAAPCEQAFGQPDKGPL